MKGKKLFKNFHGRESEKIDYINLHSFNELVFLGDAIAIEYKAKKVHLGNKVETYRHKFLKGCKLFTNGKELLIYGKSIKINTRGIIG
jgi:hypothetical protein